MADDDKTESATPKRRHEHREKGNVARSREVLTLCVLGATLLALWMSAGFIYEQIGGLTAYIFGNLDRIELDRASIGGFAMRVTTVFGLAVAPVLVAAVVAGVAGNLAQVGFVLSTKPLEPDFTRLNPFRGFGSLFKPEKLLDLLKSCFKVVVLGLTAYLTIRGDLANLPFLCDADPMTFAVYQLDLAFRLTKNILLVYAVIAVIDYATQKWQYEKSIRMSKDEVKDEYKQSEGDPQVRRRIRRLQVEMTRRRMMAEVPKADVVVTNPTHYAVALRYDAEEMEAPLVLAKGADLLARRIISIAEENGVTVYRAPEVARALYRDTEPGDTIPFDMFKAVAEILAHVYRLTRRTPPPAPAPPPPPGGGRPLDTEPLPR